jgi:uncharacterized membrane protein
MKRLMKHALTGQWHVSRLLSGEASRVLTDAVREAERGHSGQIRVVIEGTPGIRHVLKRRTARDRAIDLFSLERVWDTTHNNGVLLYLMVAERDAEIVADRGLNGKVRPEQWQEICTSLERDVHTHGFSRAVCAAITSIGNLVRTHFPGDSSPNELPDDVIIRGR